MPAERLLMLSMQLLKKRITVIPLLRNLWPLLNCIFCIEFQDFELMLNDVWCQKWMRTGKGHPLWCLLIGDDECQLIAKSHKETVFYMCRDQLYCWHKDMAPIILLVASCICTIVKIAFQLYRWIKCMIY